jgi:hypothetical protein
MSSQNFSDADIAGFVRLLIDYIHAQRDRYLPLASPLSVEQTNVLKPFFPSAILEETRVVIRDREPIPNPPIISEMRSRGFDLAPDLNHLNVVSFLEVQTLHQVSDRALFHGLVHTVQGYVIGVERCLEMNIRSFLKTGRHVTIPLFVHAFQLDHRFAHSPGDTFSVEDEVRAWFTSGRYDP